MQTWASRTWTDFTKPPEKALLVVGAIEQHGPHLPVSTDVVIPDRLAREVAERTQCLTLPTLPFGARSHTRTGGGDRFPGGLFLSDRTLTDAVTDILSDGLKVGAETIFVLSWHYENTSPLWDACRTAQMAHPYSRVVLVDSPGDLMPLELIDHEYPGNFPGWAAEHAAVVETSLMMHLAPELVRTSEIPPDPAYSARPWDIWPEKLANLPDSGVFAPAKQSSAEYGKKLFEGIASGLEHVIREVR